MYAVLLLILLLPSLAHAANTYYAHPDGSGNTCSFNTPCELNDAANKAQPGDTVLLKDGVYLQSFETVRDGTKGNPITFRAVNRHKAIIRNGGSSGVNRERFDIRHSWTTVQGIQVDAQDGCTSCAAFDASRIFGDDFNANGSGGPRRFIRGIIFEDMYVHDSGHLLIWCGMVDGEGAEIRNSTFDFSGINDHRGEANYWGSSTVRQRPGICRTHHSIFSQYKANCVDFKGEMRDGHFYENFCMDQRKHVSNDEYNNHSGNGTFVIGVGKGDPDNDPTTNNRVENNIIFRPISQTMFAFVDTVQVRASGNVIVDWLPVPKGGQRRMNGDSGDMYSASATYNNIQCPDDGIQHGLQTHGSETPNKINRPMAECTARIHQIIGKPEITFCEVGNVDDKIVVVNVSTPQNPPARLKSGGQLQVTFNGTNQTGENTTQHSEQQMRIALTTAPDSDDIVRVYAAEGVIQNSAFIGGKSCLNGDNYGNEDYTRGEGFCGENVETDPAIECTNNITDDGPRLLRKH